MAKTEKLLYFDYETLASELASWDALNHPGRVMICDKGYPEDPRAVSPQIIQFVESELKDRNIQVEIGSPSCQVWLAEGGSSPDAGMGLAAVLKRNEPLPLHGQIFHLVGTVAGLREQMDKPYRAFRVTEKKGTVLREFDELSEAADAIATWQGLEDTLVVGATTKELVRGLLLRGNFMGFIEDPLPVICQVGVALAEGEACHFLMQIHNGKTWETLEATSDEGERIAQDLEKRLKKALRNRS